ncbi:MAG: hypothetical protein P4L86_15315 [Mycobacterium sp.]|nr:hypothetical protein [Mycobacterium sp.]
MPELNEAVQAACEPPAHKVAPVGAKYGAALLGPAMVQVGADV